MQANLTHLAARIRQRACAVVSTVVPALKYSNYLIEENMAIFRSTAVDFYLQLCHVCRKRSIMMQACDADAQVPYCRQQLGLCEEIAVGLRKVLVIGNNENKSARPAIPKLCPGHAYWPRPLP